MLSCTSLARELASYQKKFGQSSSEVTEKMQEEPSFDLGWKATKNKTSWQSLGDKGNGNNEAMDIESEVHGQRKVSVTVCTSRSSPARVINSTVGNLQSTFEGAIGPAT